MWFKVECVTHLSWLSVCQSCKKQALLDWSNVLGLICMNKYLPMCWTLRQNDDSYCITSGGSRNSEKGGCSWLAQVISSNNHTFVHKGGGWPHPSESTDDYGYYELPVSVKRRNSCIFLTKTKCFLSWLWIDSEGMLKTEPPWHICVKCIEGHLLK